MTITRRRPAAAALAALSAGAALAQGDAAWPSRPVTLAVPCAAGGGPTDAVARILAARPTADLGRPFMVDNRTGANGAIPSNAALVAHVAAMAAEHGRPAATAAQARAMLGLPAAPVAAAAA